MANSAEIDILTMFDSLKVSQKLLAGHLRKMLSYLINSVSLVLSGSKLATKCLENQRTVSRIGFMVSWGRLSEKLPKSKKIWNLNPENQSKKNKSWLFWKTAASNTDSQLAQLIPTRILNFSANFIKNSWDLHFRKNRK